MVKNQKGITLIALIITIIVMLILVGVTINIALNGGLFEKAETASKETEKELIKELVMASYVFEDLAAQEQVLSFLDMPETGIQLYKNLTTSGFKLQDEGGNEFTTAEAFIEANGGDEITSFDLNIQGKYGQYEGTVGERGLTSEGIKIKDKNNQGGGSNTTPIQPADENLIRKYFLGEKEEGGILFNSVITLSGDVPFITFIDNDIITDATDNLHAIDVGLNGEESIYVTVEYTSGIEYKIETDKDPFNNNDAIITNVTPLLEQDNSLTELEKYFKGRTGEGRFYGLFLEPVDGGIGFKNNPVMQDASTSIIFNNIVSDGLMITYKGTNYKVKLRDDENSDFVKTAEVIDMSNSMLGKWVEYDGKLWRVLYDEGEYSEGVQLITNDAYEDIYLTERDKDINWNDEQIIEEANITSKDNLSETEVLSSKEKNLYIYNNAIKILNDKCATIITDKSKIATDEQGNYKIRNVGSDPENPNTDSAYCTYESLKSLPSYLGATYEKGTLYGKIKDGDYNYEIDLERMEELDAAKTGNSKDYWLASRNVSYSSNEIRFYMRYCYGAYGYKTEDIRLSISGDYNNVQRCISRRNSSSNNIKEGCTKRGCRK